MKPYLLILIAACLPVVAQTPGAIPGNSTVLPYVSLVQSAGSDCIFALHTDTITGMACANTTTDGTTEAAFANGVSIPANVLSNNSITLQSQFLIKAGASASNLTLALRLGGIGGTQIFKSPVTSVPAGAGVAALTMSCTISAIGASSSSTPLVVTCSNVQNFLGTIAGNNILLSTTTQSIATDTTTLKTLVWTAQYASNNTGNAVGLYSMFNGIR